MRTSTPGVPPNPNSGRSQKRGLFRVLPPQPPLRPEPPGELTTTTRKQWVAFWASPLATHVIESDLPALQRLFFLYGQREEFLDEGMHEPLIEGSQKQQILSPFLREVDVLDAKILALEDRFGMSPLSRLKLQVIVGDASRSLEETNRRISSGALDQDDEPDLRRPAKRVPAAKV